MRNTSYSCMLIPLKFYRCLSPYLYISFEYNLQIIFFSVFSQVELDGGSGLRLYDGSDVKL